MWERRDARYVATVAFWVIWALATVYMCLDLAWEYLQEHRVQIAEQWGVWHGPVLHVLAWAVLGFCLLINTYLLVHHLSWLRRGRGLGTSDQRALFYPLVYGVAGLIAVMYLPHGFAYKAIAVLGFLAHWFLCTHALPGLYARILGRRSLLRAVLDGDVPALEALLGADADPHFRDSDGYTPYGLGVFAAERDALENADVLTVLSRSMDAGMVGRQVASPDEGIAPRLEALSKLPVGPVPAEEGAQLECLRMHLHSAALSHYWHGVAWGVGSLPEINEADDYGWTPLHEAAFARAMAFTESLLKEGRQRRQEARDTERADVDARTAKGWTPLHMACYFGYGDIARLLLRAGADLRALDTLRRTPADLARARGYTRLARLLPRKLARLALLPWWSPMDFCEDGVPAPRAEDQ